MGTPTLNNRPRPLMWLPRSFTLFLLTDLASAVVTNTTSDDSDLSFAFTGTFWNVITPTSPCDSCSSKPDPSKTHGGTWHDGNINRNPGAPPGAANTSGSFTFMGTAVYIFGIDQAVLQPDIVFTLGSTKQVHHYTGTESYVYDALFFSAQGLASDQTHTVNWVLTFADTPVGVQAVLFDYAIVTSGEDAAESTTSGPVSSQPLTTSSEVTAPNTTSLGNTVSSSPISSGLGPSKSNGGIVQSNGGTSRTNSGESQFDATISSQQAPSRSAPTTSKIPVAAAPVGASSKSKSNNLGAIVGGVVIAALVVVLSMLLVWRRLRRVRRVEPQNARTQFLRIEDYPLHTRQVTHSTPISQSQRRLASNTSLLAAADHQAMIPMHADSSRAALESETPAVMDY